MEYSFKCVTEPYKIVQGKSCYPRLRWFVAVLKARHLTISWKINPSEHLYISFNQDFENSPWWFYSGKVAEIMLSWSPL